MTQNTLKRCPVCGDTKWYIRYDEVPQHCHEAIQYLCVICTTREAAKEKVKQAMESMSDEYICMLICTSHNSKIKRGTSDSQTRLSILDITQTQIDAWREKLQLRRENRKNGISAKILVREKLIKGSAELSDAYVRQAICQRKMSKQQGLKPEDISQERVDIFRARLQLKRVQLQLKRKRKAGK